MSILLPCLGALLASKSATGAELRIHNASELIEFSNSVNGGKSFSGSTIVLDSDIVFTEELSRQFEPIGKKSNYGFQGTFDGQGYAIRNLEMTSSLQYVGLFGYSKISTIKNVVIDSSCSVVSSYTHEAYSYSDGPSYTGGISASCYPRDGFCRHENNVNMASVTFSGNTAENIAYLGGITGHNDYSSNHYSVVKNCANYGSVTYSGKSDTTYIGGVCGYSEGSSSDVTRLYIRNCVNYGTVTHDGTTSYILYIGGIAGFCYSTRIENCVSSGSIVSPKMSVYIGSIAGEIYYSSSGISNCYWDENIAYDAVAKEVRLSLLSNNAKFNSNFELNETVSIGGYKGTSLIEALNEYASYYTLRDHSRWTLNKEGKSVSFTVNNRAQPSLTLSTPIILLPTIVNGGELWFDGWYTDESCVKAFTGLEIGAAESLYGKWEENPNHYTVSFDTRGGTPIEPMSLKSGTVIALQKDVERSDCSVMYWRNKLGDKVDFNFAVPARNITLYAVWNCTRITSAGDLVDLSRLVVSGEKNYEGATVFLDSDIVFTDELSREFEPIGHDNWYYFKGSFDGQGHTISNLVVSTTYTYIGLFGYSDGITVKNVVVDSSCSFSSKLNSEDSTIGVFVAYCDSYQGPCNIENNVNMASVTFNGNVSSRVIVYASGFAGQLLFSGHDSFVKNCANYGSITHSGKSTDSHIGGIVGYAVCYIQNCINYGTITYSGTTKDELYIGGIAGYHSDSYIENCVSTGRIISANSSAPIGSIIGKVGRTTEIAHSFWASDLVYNASAPGYGDPIISDETGQATLDVELVKRLNDYASKNSSWSRWAMLHMNGGKFDNSVPEHETYVALNFYFPDPSKEGYIFNGWFKDAVLTERYNVDGVNAAADAYAKFTLGKCTVTLDVNGGNELAPNEMTVTLGSSYGTLPTPSRAGYTFAGWLGPNNESISSETIVSIQKDHTLRAQWTEILSTKVEIVFNSGGLTESQVRTIVKQYTTEVFNVLKIENVGSDKVMAIIEFADVEIANKFVQAVRSIGEGSDVQIDKVVFNHENHQGFSSLYQPFLFLALLSI